MQVGELFLTLGLDTAEFDKGIDDAESKADSGGSRIAGFLGGIGKAALGGAVVGIAALGTALVEGISSAAEAEQIMAQTEAVIKSTGGAANLTATEVSDLAASLSAASGASLFGDDQIQGAENILLTFTNIKDESFKAATAIAVDMATALGTDPQAQAMALGKALNDPIAGVAALSRVGVTFTDQQKEQIKAMQEAGDVAGAQQIILAELGKEFGGSAAASAATFTGQMTTLKDRFGELLESIGAKVLPILTQFVSFLNSPEVQAGIQAFADALVNGVELTMTFISETVIPALIEAFNLIKPAIDLVASIFAGAGTNISTLGTQVTGLGMIWTGLKTTFDTILPPIKALVMSVFGIIAKFLHDHGDEIKAFLQATWATIQEIIKLAAELIQATIVPIFQAIAKFISDHKEEIVTLLTNAWNVISAVIKAALAIIKGVIKTVTALIHGDLEGAWDAIEEMFSTVWASIKTIIDAAISNIKTVLSLAWAAIGGTVTTAWEAIKSSILTALDNAKKGLDTVVANIKTALSNAWDAVKNTASTMWDNIKSAILSPFENAKKGIDVIVNAGGGVKSILSNAWSSIQSAANTAWGNITGAINTEFEKAKGKVDGVIGGIKSLLSGAWSDIKEGASGAWGGIANAIGSAFDDVTSKIKGIVNQAIRYVNRLISAYNEVAGTLGLGELTRIPELARGTNFFKGGVALVGERGPELVNLPRGSAVTPAAQTAQQLAPRNFYFSQYVTTATDPMQELAMAEAFANAFT